MNTGKAAYGILSTNSNVTTLVGTRIFPEIAEQEAATPFIVYQLQSVDPDDTHDGPSELDEVRFEFICYADTYNQAADVGEKVRGALDRVSGTYNGVNVESIQFNDVDINIEYDPRRYSQVLTFTFRIKRDDVSIALGTPVTGAVLGDLSDVNVTGVSNGQVIAYNNHSENWEAANVSSGATTLDQLTDTQVSTAAAGTILSWNGAYWVPIAQSTPPSTTDALSEGTSNLYYTEARVSANTNVAANTAKVGITTDQANAITANTAKTSFPGFGTSGGTALEGDTALLQLGTTSTTALAGNTALLQLGTSSTTALAGDTTTITTTQASEITANTAKNSYPSADASKLSGIETSADVTDATNVAAAGALMAASAQLTGNLDTQANEINTTTSNGNVKVAANGTGLLEVRGNVGGGSDDNPGAIKLNCAQNSHGITIKSPAHSVNATYTLTLPANDGDADQVLKTDGSGNLDWVAQTIDTNTNLGNTNLTADNNRSYDQNGNNLTIDPNGGTFSISDSSGAPATAEIQVGQGALSLMGLTFPSSDGTSGQAITTNGSGTLSFSTISSGGLGNVVEDTSPQLGGSLDVNGNKIVSTSNADIDIEPNGTGDVLLGNFKFDADQSVGSGQDNYVLTYDDSTGKIGLEASAGGGGGGGISNVVEDTTPQLGGDLDTNTKNIVFAKTSATDHSSNGDIVKLGSGSTTQGALHYLNSTGGWTLADADATGTAGGVLLAIALGADPDADGMLLRGMYTLDHDPGTIGDELYVGAASQSGVDAGDITATAPSGTGDIVRVVGYCLDSTNGQIWFNPSNDFIELA
jgi:hypothetical protein